MHTMRAGVVVDQRLFDDAAAACREAIRVDPHDAWPYNNLGDVLRRQRKLDDVIECFHKAIAIDSRKAVFHVNLGRALIGKKELDDAILAFNEALTRIIHGLRFRVDFFA
jgi:superkiller protein 3